MNRFRSSTVLICVALLVGLMHHEALAAPVLAMEGLNVMDALLREQIFADMRSSLMSIAGPRGGRGGSGGGGGGRGGGSGGSQSGGGRSGGRGGGGGGTSSGSQGRNEDD